jgi:hypothetical protein
MEEGNDKEDDSVQEVTRRRWAVDMHGSNADGLLLLAEDKIGKRCFPESSMRRDDRGFLLGEFP